MNSEHVQHTGASTAAGSARASTAAGSANIDPKPWTYTNSPSWHGEHGVNTLEERR